MKGAVLFVFFCVCARAQPASIEGVAVHAVSGEPISGVHIRLSAAGFDTAGETYGAMSDAAGHFSMARVAAGSYLLTVERTGFVFVRKTPAAGPASSLTLKTGERLADLKLELAPRAIIAGRVVDEYGDPVAGASVRLETTSRESPPASMGSVGTTDERGEFRLRVGPGKYRVHATPRPMYAPEPEVRADGSPNTVYGPTYFPGTPNREQASLVETTPGGEVNGIEIRLTRRSGFTIAGTVTGMPENGFATVMLQFGDRPNRVSRTSGRGLQHDGTFSFGMMEPGFYRIFAFYPSGQPPLQSQAVEFKLESDVTSLQLALAPGGEITGTLQFAGGGVPTEKRTVRLKPDIQFLRMPSAEVDKEGAFRMTNVLPQKFRVQVDPLPDNAYIKGVNLDGADVPRGVLDFSGGTRDAKLKITVGRNGGQIGGVVDKGGPITMVYLLQDPDDAPQEHTARLTAEGKYSFKAIRPGRYRLFAIDPLRSRPDNTGDLLKELFARAEEIEIKEGDRITRDAKVLEGSRGTQ